MSRDMALSREQVLAMLRSHEQELRRRGVRHAALFGSVARGEATSESDIDVMIELAPEAEIGLFEYVAIVQYVAGIFPRRVDIANRSSLKAQVRTSAERDAVYAF